jgi:hypothetical protein
LIRLPRLPIPAGPAECETLTSYLGRLAGLHGMHPLDLWEPISTPRPGGRRRDVIPERLAAITGRTVEQLAQALPELRTAPDWAAWRHKSQPGCPRCNARHGGGPVTRLLPHHRYLCLRHRYWIGPPDIGQPATPITDPDLNDLVGAQRRHLRLLHTHGAAACYDAVLSGFLICGHIWDKSWHEQWLPVHQRWDRRTHHLIPIGSERTEFSAARIFAAAYPEAVLLAELIASPRWRHLAAGDAEQQQPFHAEIGRRLAHPDYQPPEGGDAIAHWMKYDAPRPPSRPKATFPHSSEHGAISPTAINRSSLQRHHKSALWFSRNRRGGGIILHHRHVWPVLVRDWSTPMDGIQATIWASTTTHDLHRDDENHPGTLTTPPPRPDDAK